MTTSRAAAAQRTASILRAAALAIVLAPLVLLAIDWAEGALKARPWDALTHWSGKWAVWLLLLTLAITPLRRIGQWPKLALTRRRLGVGTACYAGFHLFCFLALQGFSVGMTASEIVLRVYLAIGFSALLILLALALTSTDRATRWMGGPGWQALHRLVYLAAILAILHYFQQTKAAPVQAALRAGILIWLLGWRIQFWLATRSGQRRTVGALGLVLLTLIAAPATALLEAWTFSLKAGAPFERVLMANFSFGATLRPAWIVLAAGLALAALAWWRGRAKGGAKGGVTAKRPAAATT